MADLTDITQTNVNGRFAERLYKAQLSLPLSIT